MYGATFEAPQACNAPGFVSERVKVGQVEIGHVEEIHYHHLGADGARGALAFADRGQSVAVHDWTNPAVIREAMALSAAKWGAITLTGTAAYKEAALRVAAQHGYEITNPELQQRFAQEKARAAEALSPSIDAGSRNGQPSPAATQQQGSAGDVRRHAQSSTSPGEAMTPVRPPAEYGATRQAHDHGQPAVDDQPKSLSLRLTGSCRPEGRSLRISGAAREREEALARWKRKGATAFAADAYGGKEGDANRGVVHGGTQRRRDRACAAVAQPGPTRAPR